MAQYIIQIIVAGAQVVGRAFTRAMQQEIQASQQAAQRLGNARATKNYVDDAKMGISLEEAKQILNVANLDKQEITTRYNFLYKANDAKNGGSFYLQSKVVRAKERLEHEMKQSETPEADSPKPSE